MSLEIKCLEPNKENVQEGDLLVVEVNTENVIGAVFLPIVEFNEEKVVGVYGSFQCFRKYKDVLVLKKDGSFLVGKNLINWSSKFLKIYKRR